MYHLSSWSNVCRPHQCHKFVVVCYTHSCPHCSDIWDHVLHQHWSMSTKQQQPRSFSMQVFLNVHQIRIFHFKCFLSNVSEIKKFRIRTVIVSASSLKCILTQFSIIFFRFVYAFWNIYKWPPFLQCWSCSKLNVMLCIICVDLSIVCVVCVWCDQLWTVAVKYFSLFKCGIWFGHLLNLNTKHDMNSVIVNWSSFISMKHFISESL